MVVYVQMLKQYNEEYEERCRKLQEVFEQAIQAFSVDDDEEHDDDENGGDADAMTSNNSDSTAPVNGAPDSNDGSAVGENGSAGEGSPKHVSTIIVNGGGSPVKDAAQPVDNKDSEGVPQGGQGAEEEKGNLDEKVNSKEELTTM
jgi:hypothetical protein